jgi:regulatory protein
LKDFDDSLENALKSAFRLLGYRDRSEKEICERLAKKGFSQKTIKGVVVYLTERGFVDDRRLAGALKRHAVEKKHLGKRGTTSYLIKRGIPLEIAAGISGDEDDYFDSAKMLVERRLQNMKGYDTATIKRRLWGLLSRRGFSNETIHRVIKTIDLKEEET